MRFEELATEGQLIELFGDRVESCGNDLIGGLAWIGQEKVVWAESKSDRIRSTSIRRLKRLFQLSNHSRRSIFLTADLIELLAHQIQQSSLAEQVVVQSWLEQVLIHSSPIIVLKDKKEQASEYAEMLADCMVSNLMESIQAIQQLCTVEKEDLQQKRRNRIFNSVFSQENGY